MGINVRGGVAVIPTAAQAERVPSGAPWKLTFAQSVQTRMLEDSVDLSRFSVRSFYGRAGEIVIALVPRADAVKDGLHVSLRESLQKPEGGSFPPSPSLSKAYFQAEGVATRVIIPAGIHEVWRRG